MSTVINEYTIHSCEQRMELYKQEKPLKWHNGKENRWPQNIDNTSNDAAKTSYFSVAYTLINESIFLPHLACHSLGADYATWNSSYSIQFLYEKRSTGSDGKSPRQQWRTQWGGYGGDGQTACMSMYNAKPDCFQ